MVDFGGTSAPAAFTYAWPEAPGLTLKAPTTTLAPGTVALTGVVKNGNGLGSGAVLMTLQARAPGAATFANLATATTATNDTFSFSRAVTASTELRITVINDIASPVLALTIVPRRRSGHLCPHGHPKRRADHHADRHVPEERHGHRRGTAARSVVVNAAGASLTFVTPARPLGVAAVVVTTPTGAGKPLNFVYQA